MFNLLHCGYYVSPPNITITNKRKVEYYEIELYSEHNGISVLNDKIFKPKKNDVLIAKPNDIRQSRGQFSCYYARFSCNDEQVVSIIESISGLSESTSYSYLISLFNNLSKAQSLGRDLDAYSVVLQIISTLYYCSTTNNSEFFRYSKQIEKAQVFTQENLDKKFSLNDLAMIANLSPSFFHKVFKSLVGLTPNEYVILKRIEKSKELLLNNDLSIDEISYKCGFSSRSYFDKAFKKTVALTPANFREEMNKII